MEAFPTTRYSIPPFARLPEEVDGVYPACAGFDLLATWTLNIFVKETIVSIRLPHSVVLL